MTQEEQKALEEEGKKALDEESKEGSDSEASQEGEDKSEVDSDEQHIEEKGGEQDKDYKKAYEDTVAQLKEERKKRRLAEVGNVEEDVKDTSSDEKPDDIEVKVKEAIKKEKQEDAKKNRQKALVDFWKKHPEFDPDNDISGLRMDSLERVMKQRFNTSNSTSYDDIMTDYEDAYFYINKDKKPEKKEVDKSEIASESQVPAHEKVDSNAGLTPSEKKLAAELGMDDKRFLEIKKKYPQIVSQ